MSCCWYCCCLCYSSLSDDDSPEPSHNSTHNYRQYRGSCRYRQYNAHHYRCLCGRWTGTGYHYHHCCCLASSIISVSIRHLSWSFFITTDGFISLLSGAVLGKNIWGPGPSSFGRQQRAELLCPIVHCPVLSNLCTIITLKIWGPGQDLGRGAPTLNRHYLLFSTGLRLKCWMRKNSAKLRLNVQNLHKLRLTNTDVIKCEVPAATDVWWRSLHLW